MAPEVRGASFLSILPAALRRAAMFAIAFSQLHNAQAADLARWHGPAPVFTLPDVTGGETALRQARGRLVLVHFFATWCEPCREELPALERLAARGRDRLIVLPVALDESELRVRRLRDSLLLQMPVLLDRNRAVARAWRVTTLPTTFVLDAALRPRLAVEADVAWDTVDPATLAAEAGAAHDDASHQRQPGG